MPKRFEELIAQGEGISIEFKECKDALPKNVFETLCAFLNRFGGDIFLGLKDDGTIIGVDKDKSKKIRADFVSAMNNPQKIFPTVYLPVDEFELDGKTILHVYVPESSQVHNTNRRIFDRNEDGDFDITDNTDLVAAMYIRKQREYTENTVFPYAWGFPSPFAACITAAISFFSARVSLRFTGFFTARVMVFRSAIDNSRYLLFQFSLFFYDGIKIFRLIGAFLWSDKLCLNDVLYHDFKGLPVFFIHCQEEAGKHNDNHCKCRHACSRAVFEQKEKR